jgi:hypothetical protein
MIFGDGTPFDVAMGVAWCACGVLIGAYYVFRIGWRVLFNSTGVKQRVWGSFIFSCGIGHWAMVGYMTLYPESWFFQAVVVPIDILTLIATAEAGHRSPDVPS